VALSGTPNATGGEFYMFLRTRNQFLEDKTEVRELIYKLKQKLAAPRDGLGIWISIKAANTKGSGVLLK
jgi:hypothetical protein